MMKKIYIITPLLFMLFTLSVKAQQPEVFENVPRVGNFTVTEVRGINPGEKIDLVCISETNDVEIYDENILVEDDGSLKNPREISRDLCAQKYAAFRMTDPSQNERYSYPFAYFIEPPTQIPGEKIPNIWSANAVFLDEENMVQLNILSSTINYYFISGDVAEENIWKEYVNQPMVLRLKNSDEINTVYLTFANNNILKTFTIKFHPELQNVLESDLMSLVGDEEARAFAKLLTGQELSEKDITYILENTGSAKNYLDPDNDGLTTDYEIILGTDPFNSDTDGDGISDGKEVLLLGTDPLSPQTTDDLRFINIQDDQQVQKNTSFISGKGTANTLTTITFHNAETNEIIFTQELTTDNEGIFRVEIPDFLEDKNFTITANQKGVKTEVANIKIGDIAQSLNFTVDAINEVEIPLNAKTPVVMEIKKETPLTLYGSITANLIPSDTKITITIDENEQKLAAQFVVKKNSLGLFAINLPIENQGDYKVTVQSSNETGLGPSFVFPLRIKHVEKIERFTHKETKELNYYLLAFIALVGTLSVYTFLFHRKKQ